MELHVMKYDTAMKSSDAEQWRKAVEKEYERMEENGVWTPVPKSTVPTNAKVLTSTWAMKKKSNGTFRARLNARGFEQVPGIHFDPKSVAAPVVSLMTIRIVFVLMIMAGWTGHVLDVRGAFLKGDLLMMKRCTCMFHREWRPGMEQRCTYNCKRLCMD